MKEPTQEDYAKLMRVLEYLHGTRDLDKHINISAYIDASYAIHSDFKSHSGIYVSMGRGPIYCNSSKQRINS